MGDLCLRMEMVIQKIDALEARTKELSEEVPMSIQHRPLTTDQVCKLVHRKKDTVYRLARAGEIPCYKKGKFFEFFEDEIISWLSEKKVVGPAQTVAEAREYCSSHQL